MHPLKWPAISGKSSCTTIYGIKARSSSRSGICLVLAPTFIATSVYLTLKHTILYLDPTHLRLQPRLFAWIFIGCDIESLLLQAAGSSVVAAAGVQIRGCRRQGMISSSPVLRFRSRQWPSAVCWSQTSLSESGNKRPHMPNEMSLERKNHMKNIRIIIFAEIAT